MIDITRQEMYPDDIRSYHFELELWAGKTGTGKSIAAYAIDPSPFFYHDVGTDYKILSRYKGEEVVVFDNLSRDKRSAVLLFEIGQWRATGRWRDNQGKLALVGVKKVICIFTYPSMPWQNIKKRTKYWGYEEPCSIRYRKYTQVLFQDLDDPSPSYYDDILKKEESRVARKKLKT